MIRREFIAGLAATASPILWTPSAFAQRPAVLPVIGFLYNGSIVETSVAPYRGGLNETGYVEGRNVAIEYRGAEDHYDRLPGLAADLVGRKVAVIAAVGALPAILAAKAATTTIPIVFAIGGDPVQLGLVTSLNRPGGNLTGATNLNGEILPKRLQLLHEFVPNAAKVALLVNPTNPATETQLKEAQDAARILGLQLVILHARTESEFDTAFSTAAQLRAAGLVIAGDGLFFNQMEKLAQLALLHKVPAIFQARRFVAAGGLISYGGIAADAFRIAGVYTGRILKGEKPTDLPVQQATKVELFINFNTAKALGLNVPLPLLGRADEVIE